MRSVLSWLILMVFVVEGYSQQLNPLLSGDQAGHTIGLYGTASVRSNVLRVKFLRDIYTGKSLDRDLREKQADAAAARNRAGADLNYGLFYRHLPDSVTAGWGWGVNLGARIHGNGTFTDDGYKLAMLGNAQFAGEVAELSKSGFNLYNYKYFGASLIKDIPLKTGHFRIGITANFLMAQQQASARFDNAWLFTQEFGEYLDLSFGGTIQSNGLSNGQYFAANGYGVGADLILQMVRPKHTFSLELGDMGALFMNSSGRGITLDTMIRFEGIALDLFNTGDEPFSALSPDSLTDMLGVSEDTGSYNAVLPFYVHLRSEHKLADGKYSVFGGIQYRFAPAYFPLIYAGASFNLPKAFALQPTFAWGGYGSWNVGFEVRKKFKERVSLALGSNNLEGLIVPRSATGLGAYLNLAVHF